MGGSLPFLHQKRSLQVKIPLFCRKSGGVAYQNGGDPDKIEYPQNRGGNGMTILLLTLTAGELLLLAVWLLLRGGEAA